MNQAPDDMDILTLAMRDHRKIMKEASEARTSFEAGKLDRASAIDLFQNRLLPENQKTIQSLKPVSPQYPLAEMLSFKKTLIAYEAVLNSSLKMIKEGKTNANMSEYQQNYSAYTKAFAETEKNSDDTQAVFQKFSNALDRAKEKRAASGSATNSNSLPAANPGDINSMLPPPISKSSPTNIAASGGSAAGMPVPAATKPAVVPAPRTGSAANSCRASLSRYPRVSPSMMTLCRQANDHSAKVMDVYTAIYKGGMAKTLMDAIMAVNSEDQATCAIQIANKFRGSMTSKYLRETCL